MIGIVGHFWIKITKNGWPLVIFGMIGIVNLQVFNRDRFRHITGVAEIMLTRIRSADQGCAAASTTCGDENAVAYNDFSLPCAAIVGAQVDEASSADGGIFYG